MLKRLINDVLVIVYNDFSSLRKRYRSQVSDTDFRFIHNKTTPSSRRFIVQHKGSNAICGYSVEKIILSCLPLSTNVINSKRKEKRLGHTFVHALKPIKY